MTSTSKVVVEVEKVGRCCWDEADWDEAAGPLASRTDATPSQNPRGVRRMAELQTCGRMNQYFTLSERANVRSAALSEPRQCSQRGPE